jgi:hypothetical protein
LAEWSLVVWQRIGGYFGSGRYVVLRKAEDERKKLVEVLGFEQEVEGGLELVYEAQC